MLSNGIHVAERLNKKKLYGILMGEKMDKKLSQIQNPKWIEMIQLRALAPVDLTQDYSSVNFLLSQNKLIRGLIHFQIYHSPILINDILIQLSWGNEATLAQQSPLADNIIYFLSSYGSVSYTCWWELEVTSKNKQKEEKS